MAVKAGALGLTVGGVDYNIESDGAKYSVDSIESESILGAAGKVGDTEKGSAAYIECTVLLDETQDSSDLRVRNEIVLLRLRDRTVTLSGAGLVGKIEPDASKITVRYEGITGKEVR